jgi:hypothetical protein
MCVPTKAQSHGVIAHKLDAMVVQCLVPCVCAGVFQSEKNEMAMKRHASRHDMSWSDEMVAWCNKSCVYACGVEGATSVMAKRRCGMSSPAGLGGLIKVKMELHQGARLAAENKEGINNPIDPGGLVKAMISGLSSDDNQLILTCCWS